MLLPENSYLKLRVYNAVANLKLEVNIIEIDKNKKLVIEEYEFTPANDRLEKTYIIKLPHEELAFLTIKTNTQCVRGQLYCIASIQRGEQQGAKELITLLAGYVTKAKPLSYPPVYIENATSGVGNIVTKEIEVFDAYEVIILSPTNTLSKIHDIAVIVNSTATSAANKLIITKYLFGLTTVLFEQKYTIITPATFTVLIANFGFQQTTSSSGTTDVADTAYITTHNLILTPNEELRIGMETKEATDAYQVTYKVEELFYI